MAVINQKSTATFEQNEHKTKELRSLVRLHSRFAQTDLSAEIGNNTILYGKLKRMQSPGLCHKA